MCLMTSWSFGFLRGRSWADTTTPHGELMVTILAGLATFERHLIKARAEDGRKRAEERGVRFGRPPKLTSSSCAA